MTRTGQGKTLESSVKRLLLLMAASGLLLAAAPAQAQFPGDVPDTFRLQLGGMYAWFNTGVTLQENIVTGGPLGGRVSLEDILRVPSPRAGFSGWGSWNFAGRSFIDFGYVGFSRSRMATISRDIIFGDTTYKAGASVSTSMKSSLPYLDYRYGFVKNDKMQFGLSLGVSYPMLKSDLTATGGVVGPGGPIVGQTVTKTAELSTPLPFLGFTFEGRVADGLSAGVRLNGIFASIHPYSGSVFDGELHIDWFASRNFGVGAAYAYTKFAVKRQDAKTLVDFSYRYDGPRLYVIATF